MTYERMRTDKNGLVLPAVDMEAYDRELLAMGFVFEDDPEDGAESEITFVAEEGVMAMTDERCERCGGWAVWRRSIAPLLQVARDAR